MIFFIQPAVPKYRIPFFKKIINSGNDVFIYTTEKDFLGVSTVDSDIPHESAKSFIKFPGNFYWHRNLPLWRRYSKKDIVIVSGNPRVINYMVLLILLKIKGVRSIWWGHGWSAGSFKLRAKIRIFIMKLLSNYQLFYTDDERKNFKKGYALNNGLDQDDIKKYIGDFPKKKINPSSDKIIKLLFIGRVTNKSNFKLLLRALSKCPGNVILNVIGEYPPEYIDMCNELHINDRVIWHGKTHEEIEIARIMLDSHVFVYPGAVGLSLIHAFNYGLPAIVHSSKEFHMPEFCAFSNSVNGYSFDKDDVNSLCLAIKKFINIKPEEYERLCMSALKTVQVSFNVDDMVYRFQLMLEEIKNDFEIDTSSKRL